MSEQALSPQGRPRELMDVAVGPGTMPQAWRASAAWRLLVRREGRRYLVGLGILWLLLGMVIMPAGVSFNPGKAYQGSLIVLMYLPALCLAFAERGRLWRELWRLPLFRVFLLLLAWATLSLLWAHLHRPGDELGRLLSVMTFVLAWQLWDADGEDYMSMLLFVGGIAVALCAGYYCVTFLVHPDPADMGRIAGEGTIAATNYAAALMGAVTIWLSQLRLRTRRLVVLRWTAIALLLFFIVLTHTRGVWLALGACVVTAPMWQSTPIRRWAWAMAAMLVALAVALPLHLLTERGMSLRPELLSQSLQQIVQRPWLGLGQGAPITLWVAGAAYTHSHNLLTQVTLELGLPGLALTVAMWLMVGWQGWRHRQELRGRILLGLWVYASVVLQFDMPQLLDSPRPGWILIWLPFSLAIGMAMRERAASRPDIMSR